MKIKILVNESSPASVVSGTVDLFANANVMWKEINSESAVSEFFKVELVTAYEDPVICMNEFPVHCDKSIDEVKEADLVVITPITDNIKDRIKENSRSINWLKDKYNNGTEIASLCSGAFLLGATGLVDYKSVSTHWSYVDLFKELYPKVKLTSHKVIVDEMGLYSSGGAFSFTNLILYLIEKFCGHDVAVLVSKSMLVDMHQAPQTVSSIFIPQKDHNDQNILNAQDYIEKNFSQKLTIDDIAYKVHLSKRSLIRRFKSATGNTPNEYLQRVRIEFAKKALESGTDSIQNIVFKSGYEDQSSFRKLFKKITGLNPVDYRTRFKRLIS